MISDKSIEVQFGDLILNDIRPERDSSLKDLATSIKEIGLINPIIVVEDRDTEGNEKHRVICGRRRVLALRLLGYEKIPVTVRTMGDVVSEMTTISENIHRLDLGADRDKAIHRYAELYEMQHPTAAKDAEVRKAVGMGWLAPDESSEVKEALERPPVPSPIAAAAKAFGVTQGTIARAVRRARGFTDSQRKVLDEAKVVKADLDVLACEEEPVVAEVVNMIAAGYGFSDAMTEVLKSGGRTYTGRDGSLEEMDSRLARLSSRRGIGDPEAFDNDCKLFWAIEDEVKKFKKAIDWVYKKEIAGKNPHGLFYLRLYRLLEALDPRKWVPCRCQNAGDDRFNCTYCRGGAYQIGE